MEKVDQFDNKVKKIVKDVGITFSRAARNTLF